MAGLADNCWPKLFAALIEAGAIRPVVGFVAVLLALSTIETTVFMFSEDPMLWPARIMAGGLGLGGLGAILSFLIQD